MVLTISPVKIFTLYPVGNEDKSCHLTGTMFARNLAHDASGGRDRNAFDLSFSSNPSMNFNFDLTFLSKPRSFFPRSISRPHSTVVPPLYPRQIHSDQRTPQTLEGISSIQFVHWIYTPSLGISATSLLVNAFSRASFFSPFENQFPNLGINSSSNVNITLESEGKGNQRPLRVTEPPLLPPYRFPVPSYEHE